MYRLFDADWDDLSLDHVRGFLASAGEEGVSWEAKAEQPDGDDSGRATGRLRPEHVQRSVCGLANQVGGTVILGARFEDDAWVLPGVTLPGEEPELWLDQALAGLRPLPRCRRKTWQLDAGKVAAVLEVEPLTQTPCMTRDGQVFERVSSSTVRVTEPVRLAELFGRGERARTEAEAKAERAALTLLEHPDGFAGRSVWVAVSMAGASYEPDIGGRLFHSRFTKLLRERVGKRLFEEPGAGAQPTDLRSAIRQTYVEFGAGAPNLFWLARTGWDGAAAVVAGLAGDVVEHYSLFDGVVWPAWNLAADLVAAVGGYGDGRVQLSLRVVQPESDDMIVGELLKWRERGLGRPPPERTIYAALPAGSHMTADTHIKRWTEVREATSDEIGSVQRELQRAAGLWSFEGQPDPPE